MKPPESLAEQIATKIASIVRAEIEEAGMTVTWETVSPVLKALQTRLGVSPLDKRTAAKALQAEWAAAEGLANDVETRSKLGLSQSEWETALKLKIIVPIPVPPWARLSDEDADGSLLSERWYPTAPLGEEARNLIAENTLISTYEAASRWGMSPQKFRAARPGSGLVAVSEHPHPRYRLSDVNRLKPGN